MSKFITRLYSSHVSSRLAALRGVMNNLDAVLVPSEDAHQSEYTAECDNRRAWLSGFTGSAGCAIVTKKSAALFTDGRYFVQAANELDETEWTLMKQGLPGVPSWQEYLKQLPPGSTIGVDPTMISVGQVQELEKELKNSRLVYTDNLVDRIRTERPHRPSNEIKIHPLQYAGQSVESKLKTLVKQLNGKSTVISRLDEIAWLLNLRGSDIHTSPVFFSYCFVTPTTTTLYLQCSKKLSEKVQAQLKKSKIVIKPYDTITQDLSSFSSAFSIDPEGTNMSIIEALKSSEIHYEPSPIQLSKAIKNEAEMKGMIDCHQRDAVALCKHFAWLSNHLEQGDTIREYEAVEHLESMRQLDSLYVGPSFDTIAASGANGAIVHYSQASDIIDPQQIYLCDSGGHYLNGTTDVTRTWLFKGQPSLFQKRAFTRVLQSHITLDQTVFPQGTTGYQLNSIARQPLWKEGLDFRHGVGHGVPLQVGMIVTNEPGYYKDLEFGIRIENVLRVCTSAHQSYLGFDHLTFVPLGVKLIESELLDTQEKDWVNNYHAKCRDLLGNTLDTKTLSWLEKETAPL
ncbi:hypothetical protein CU098_001562 [Rhizopus stolonifer]|uniref:Xaa-Pro aminopeptidase P n=1 Tax=Rhizopus stolonifer TaxID=4846 RepID=A0A367KKF2_RHIST|nr:hypothetical protein CU098_001562 [Rhizopus stolonifer]